MYSAWNYEKEIEDLNRASEQGWQLVRGGVFHSKFKKDPNVRWRYQLDYGTIDDMGRYIETFREQGWEYVNSTFNAWHYFRKAYDPALPEEAYEIFTDRESLKEMNNRWAVMALCIAITLAGLSVFYGIRFFQKPHLPALLVFLAIALECGLLLRGWWIMRDPEKSRSRKGDSRLLAAILAVILLSAAVSIPLACLRPHFWTEQQAGDVDAAVTDNRWADFTVKYPDNYFLDLELEAEKPMTFSILDESGEPVYTRTETDFKEEAIKLKLSPGTYCFSISYETGYHVKAKID